MTARHRRQRTFAGKTQSAPARMLREVRVFRLTSCSWPPVAGYQARCAVIDAALEEHNAQAESQRRFAGLQARIDAPRRPRPLPARASRRTRSGFDSAGSSRSGLASHHHGDHRATNNKTRPLPSHPTCCACRPLGVEGPCRVQEAGARSFETFAGGQAQIIRAQGESSHRVAWRRRARSFRSYSAAAARQSAHRHPYQ
jgi:hypothetical protein